MEREEKSRDMVLDDLDQGRISVEEAVRQLEQIPATKESVEDSLKPATKPLPAQRWENWWLIPFSLGLVLTATAGMAGGLWGWWILAGFLGLIGLPLMILGALSQNSTWVHVRVRGKGGKRPQRIAISLPLPLGLTAMILRIVGGRIPGLQQSGVDELLLALDSFHSNGMPIHIEVQDRDGMERVEVYLG